jgi:hypothetical protein
MLATTQNSVIYSGDGATTQFGYSFPIPDLSSLVVSITNNNVSPATVTILPPSQFGVTGVGNGIAGAQIATAGGVVTYSPSGGPLGAGYVLTIARVVPLTQLTSLSNQGALYPQVLEAALDRLMMICQQQQAYIQQITVGNLQPLFAFVYGPVVLVDASTGHAYQLSVDGGVFNTVQVS